MKFILVFLTLIVVLVQSQVYTEQIKQLEEILSNLPARYCPMRGLNGQLFCPVRQQQKTDQDTVYITDPTKITAIDTDSSFMEETISEKRNETKVEAVQSTNPFSGFGYNRVTREMKFPILPSGDQAAFTPKTEHTVHRFNQVSEYLNHIFADKGYFEGGLYVQSNAQIQDMANNFGDYKVNIGVTQRQYIFWNSAIKSNSPLDEFQQIVNSLPPFDPNNPASREMYNMLIEFFGTDVATNTLHGGVVYQRSTVKSCFGGSVTEGMIQDIDSFIRRVPPGPTAYARFRNLGQVNIIGGNPELLLDRMNERVESFKAAPGVIRFQSTPIWNIVQDPTRKQWLKNAMELYINANQPNVQQIIHNVNVRRDQLFKGAQNIFNMDYHVEQLTNWVVHWTGCALIRQRNHIYTPHCTLIRNPVVLAAGQRTNYGNVNWETQSVIERDPNSGLVRTYSVFRGQVRHGSDWLRSGCVRVPYGPRLCMARLGCIEVNQRLARYACIDCVPVIRQQGGGHYGTIHTFPECHCQGFN